MSVELLAPAGSYEGLIQNLDYGADAVYTGGMSFGARAYAKNLTREELLMAIDEAHIRNKKLYLTVNTLLKNEELYRELYEYLHPYYCQGLDGVIVQDYGVMEFVRREFPDLPVHASTQMAVTGPEGATYLERLGVARVVTARELSLQEIASIRRKSSVEIESFVHGALCYSYSGQCLFSSILGGRSGNRGRCAQPCRLPYQVEDARGRLTEGKEVCPLSLKDICTIELLPQIIKAGVTSLKIEGRMKQASYSAGVVNIYRKYLDLLQFGGKYQVEDADLRELQALFNRGGFCTGYYEMRGGPKMMAFSNEKKTGQTRRNLIKTKEKVKGNLILSVGKPAILGISYQDIRLQVTGATVQEAKKQPLGKDRILEQMHKTGGTPYEFEEFTVELSGEVFLPMGALNQLRREGFETLQKMLTDKWRRTKQTEYVPGQIINRNRKNPNPIFLASCETLAQAERMADLPEIQGIYCHWDFAASMARRNTGKDIYLMLPYVVRPGDFDRLSPVVADCMEAGCKGILARNLESVCWLIDHGYGRAVIADHTLYTFNNESRRFFKERICRTTAPLELNEKELRSRENEGDELLIYGNIPMMISAQCVRKNLDRCRKDYGTLILKDRYATDFHVKCYCDFCYNVIYNSVPYGLFKEHQKVKELGFSYLRLSFTLENGEEAARIASDCLLAYRGIETPVNYTLTKGHFKRGVE